MNFFKTIIANGFVVSEDMDSSLLKSNVCDEDRKPYDEETETGSLTTDAEKKRNIIVIRSYIE